MYRQIKLIYGIAALLILPGFFSCRQKPPKQPPTILKEKKIDVSSIMKDKRNDFVEALYEELVSQSKELQELEKEIKAVKNQAVDSMDAFTSFNDKNNRYYTSAERKTESVSDSSVRRLIRSMITDSRDSYRDSTAAWQHLDSLIYRRKASIENLHTLLKVVKTLPLIEEFQRTSVPGKLPAQKIVHDFDSLILKLDSLTSNSQEKK